MSIDLESEHPIQAGFHDDPIKSRASDKLRRAPFADRMVNLIQSIHRTDSSVVYGLEGAWGSGKSSVINLIRQTLEEEGVWRVAEFAPWAAPDSDALFEEFFVSLAEAAPSLTRNERTRRLLRQYAEIARSFGKNMPGAGGLIDALGGLTDQSLRKSWKALFTEISTELQELDVPLLVIVDDIDRLQSTELLDLLKVVRLLGRFPGIDFLLAYDEETVVDTLSYGRWGAEGSDRARAFMEKIVQYPMPLPPLLRTQIVKLVEIGLSRIMGPERTERAVGTGRIQSPLTRVMPKGLGTPRAIHRFLAQVEHQFESHAEGEVDEVDLILATFLRMQFPELFAELENWKSVLTRQGASVISFDSNDQEMDLDPLFAKSAVPRRGVAEEVLRALFPAIAGLELGRSDIRRFAHPDYFDRYLAQTVPDGDIPDSVISEVLATAAGGDATSLRSLLIEKDPEEAILALTKIRDRYPDIARYGESYKHMGHPCTPELLANGMSVLDKLPDRYYSWTNERSQCTYWLASLLRILLTEDPSQDLTGQLGECESTERRAHVISTATHMTENLKEPTRVAIKRLMERETKNISRLLLENLREGDNASSDLAYTFLFELVVQFGDRSHFQDAVKKGLRRSDFTLEDVAARHVSFSYSLGGAQKEPWAAAFSADLFTQITGVPATSPNLSEKGDWADRSLRRRKEFARKYIHV